MHLRSMDDPVSEGIINMPSPDNKGEWSEMHEGRIEIARKVIEDSKAVAVSPGT